MAAGESQVPSDDEQDSWIQPVQYGMFCKHGICLTYGGVQNITLDNTIACQTCYDAAAPTEIMDNDSSGDDASTLPSQRDKPEQNIAPKEAEGIDAEPTTKEPSIARGSKEGECEEKPNIARGSKEGECEEEPNNARGSKEGECEDEPKIAREGRRRGCRDHRSQWRK